MQFRQTELDGLVVIEPKVFGDDRGYFMESFKQELFEQHVGKVSFIQENESKSSFGVLRGLHYQRPPYTQSKLVRVVQGEVLDVVVDMRSASTTFGHSFCVNLSGENKLQLFVPKGFAHGFVVLSESAIFSYKVDAPYVQAEEDGIMWNDPDLGIAWGLLPTQIKLSEKDKVLPLLKQIKSPF